MELIGKMALVQKKAPQKNGDETLTQLEIDKSRPDALNASPDDGIPHKRIPSQSFYEQS